MRSNFLRQIAAALAIVVALAPLAPLEAAKQNKRKKHRNHRSKELMGARQIQRKAAQYARELLSDLPPETLGSVSITEGTDFNAAIQKNVRDLKAAIANSSWPQAAKTAEPVASPAKRMNSRLETLLLAIFSPCLHEKGNDLALRR